jgi:hypothetical protein
LREAQASNDTQPFRNQWIAAMGDHNSLLDSFEPEMVERIRSAFQAGWHELCNASISSDPYVLRNRLARTIASLARRGISDPLELKTQALRNINASAAFN